MNLRNSSRFNERNIDMVSINHIIVHRMEITSHCYIGFYFSKNYLVNKINVTRLLIDKDKKKVKLIWFRK